MADGQGEDSDVKLALMNEKRPFDILLQDAVAKASLSPFVLSHPTVFNHMRLYFVKVVEDLDAIATVSGLTRLEDPELTWLAGCSKRLELRIKLKAGLAWYQISLWHVVEDILFARLIVAAHIQE